MTKTFTARTNELDDEILAIEQIKSQLHINEGNPFLKNTLGIVACHYEFINSGMFKAICDALPFEIVGTTSFSQAVADEAGIYLLTMMVITSDEIEFIKTLTPSLMTEPGKVITDTYKSICQEEKPKLILTFAPFILQNSGDEYVNVLTEVSGGAPCFGTLAIDDTSDFANCLMLADGESYREQMAMVLLYGVVNPKFFIANISESKILERSAVVTKSAGPVLMEVNGRPVSEYFEDLGLLEASETQYALTSLPFLLDYNDGSPKVSKIFVTLTTEKYAICAGAMPEGSTLFMTQADKEDVLATTGEAVDAMLNETENASGLLIYSCISRSMTLAADQFKEMELIQDKIENRLPFMFVCSGGEICPTQISMNNAINRFHNNAFVACMF